MRYLVFFLIFSIFSVFFLSFSKETDTESITTENETDIESITTENGEIFGLATATEDGPSKVWELTMMKNGCHGSDCMTL